MAFDLLKCELSISFNAIIWYFFFCLFYISTPPSVYKHENMLTVTCYTVTYFIRGKKNEQLIQVPPSDNKNRKSTLIYKVKMRKTHFDLKSMSIDFMVSFDRISFLSMKPKHYYLNSKRCLPNSVFEKTCIPKCLLFIYYFFFFVSFLFSCT